MNKQKEALGDVETPSTNLVIYPLTDANLKPFVPKPVVAHHRLDLAFEAYKENIKSMLIFRSQFLFPNPNLIQDIMHH